MGMAALCSRSGGTSLSALLMGLRQKPFGKTVGDPSCHRVEGAKSGALNGPSLATPAAPAVDEPGNACAR